VRQGAGFDPALIRRRYVGAGWVGDGGRLPGGDRGVGDEGEEEGGRQHHAERT
jgi:hypothetical protein